MAEWLNVDEAARYLGISSSNLYSLAQRSRIPSTKIGKVWRFSKTDLDMWLRASKPFPDFFLSTEVNVDDNLLLPDPQRESCKAAQSFFSKGGKRAIIQLPIGFGKSGLISLLPFGIARGRVLVIAPNLTIMDELRKKLDITNRKYCFWRRYNVLTQETALAGPYLTVLDGGNANIQDCMQSHIVLTNIEQLVSSSDNRLTEFPDHFFDLIVVDAGHQVAKVSLEKVFGRFPEAKTVYLTATPFRSERKDIDGELIYRYSFKRSLLRGYIKNLQAIYVGTEDLSFTYYSGQKRHTLEEVLMLKEEDWFNQRVALAPECNRHIIETSLDRLEKLRQSGTHHQLIALACSVQHAQDIRSMYAERGYEAAEIHSHMPEDRRAAVLQKLTSGFLDCIVKVHMPGGVFDHPHLSVAAIFTPFRSLSPYVQFVGQIMRVIGQNEPCHPDNYGFVVTHAGLRLDKQLADSCDMEREDKLYFEDLIQGKESKP